MQPTFYSGPRRRELNEIRMKLLRIKIIPGPDNMMLISCLARADSQATVPRTSLSLLISNERLMTHVPGSDGKYKTTQFDSFA